MDRRYYQRTKLNIDGLFYLADRQTLPREFNGTLVDISESGIKVSLDPLIPPEILDSITVDDRLHFNSYDEYEIFGQSRDTVISGEVIVVRKELSEGKVILGCKLSPLTDDLAKYISDKKVCEFMK